MVTQSHWDEIPDVAEQTQLDAPIKVRWSGKDRARVRRGLRASLADGYMERGIGYPVMTRQETQIVIKTEEELEAFRAELSYKAKHRVADRINDEIDSQLPDDDDDEVEADCLRYDPPLQDHPCYTDTVVDFAVGDVVELLSYSGVRSIRADDGTFVGSEKVNPNGTSAYHVVREIDGYRVKVAWADHDDKLMWVPRDRIVGTSDHQKALFEYRREKERRRRERIARRKETDMDTLMESVVIPHARKVVAEVWPGGTVDVDEIKWFWNPQLSDAAGMAYHGRAVPERYVSGRLAIGLAPDYYYQKGIDELLAIVRHELIHIWQYVHPNGDGGHGPTFRQWIGDLDTHRHCKTWSKA